MRPYDITILDNVASENGLTTTKPSPEQMLTTANTILLNPYEQTPLKFESGYRDVQSRKCIGRRCVQNVNHFDQDLICEGVENEPIITLYR